MTIIWPDGQPELARFVRNWFRDDWWLAFKAGLAGRRTCRIRLAKPTDIPIVEARKCQRMIDRARAQIGRKYQ